MNKTSADKKRDQRAREKEALDKHGGARVVTLMYGQTLEALERLCAQNGFRGQQRRAECITHLIHEADDAAKMPV